MNAKNEKSNSVKILHLSNDDKKVAGVCGGLGEYFNIDPTIIRLSWMILTLLTGLVPGLLAYILAIIIMPKQNVIDLDEERSNHA